MGDRRPVRPTADDGHTDRAAVRGLISFLVVAALLGGIALGAVLIGPSLVGDIAEIDEIEIDGQPSPSSEPPPAGERDPDVTDPDDPGETSHETDVETISSEDVEDFVHAEVNDRRADHGLEALEWDGTVASVSRAHSHDMAERDYFAHTNPDGEEPYDRFNDVDDYCRGYGENIAMTWVDRPVEQPDGGGTAEYQTAEGLAEGLVDQWMNSTDHREAILEENIPHTWDRGGVGVVIDDDGRVFATHNFCHEW
ncbi:CAP domain-containing protein [Natronococcus wangiae]|uniref:CAP domain-containing protein n=1 Tax=Natronococcus wangiae TaxID=3068275 RepID=UPI00273E1586|nr:CAP domain-containing protein [Natronococcus sp. AD5]